MTQAEIKTSFDFFSEIFTCPAGKDVLRLSSEEQLKSNIDLLLVNIIISKHDELPIDVILWFHLNVLADTLQGA